MKWVYSIKYKLQAALVLTIIVFVVFAKNIFDKRSMTELGNDFISIYDDRLVVESYIFRITEQLFLMKLAVNNPEQNKEQLKEDLASYRANILAIIEDIAHTRLTNKEALHLEQFKQKIKNNFNLSHQEIIPHKKKDNENIQRKVFNEDFEEAFREIEVLSEIQLSEGKKLTRISGEIINRSSMWSQLELAVLIILMVIIYLLIFSSKSIKSRITQNPSLN